MRRSLALLAGSLVLAACGGTPAGGTGAPAPTASPEPAASESTTTSTSDSNDATIATAAPTDIETPSDTAAGSTAVPAEVAPTAPAATTPATAATTPATTEAPADVREPDGCNADNSPGATDVAEGPIPRIEVRAASASNPLPDVAVRRINCAGGWVNIKNEVPGDLPVLIWLWAPH